MKNLLASLGLATFVGLASVAFAGPLAPTKASDLRTVYGDTNSTPCPASAGLTAVSLQQNANGTTTPFAIPAKSVFVVTSFDVTGSGTAGQVSDVVLIAADGAGSFSFLAKCGGVAGSNGIASGSCVTPIGTAVKAGATLCFLPNTATVLVRGFIAKDK